MRDKAKPQFNFRTRVNFEQLKILYRLHLQKAKILYFNKEMEKKRHLRKNSELLSDFNIFKIRRQQKLKYLANPGTNPDKNSLRETALKIIKLFSDHPDTDFTLEVISVTLDIDKRKIYDLVNVFTTFGLITKITKGLYQFQSIDNCLTTLQKIPSYKNLENEVKSEKSLGSMTYCYIALLKQHVKIPQSKLTNYLQKNSDSKERSKLRRIHDITRILTALEIVEINSDLMVYQGIDNFITFVKSAELKLGIEYGTVRNSRKVLKHQTQVINNLSRLIEKSDVFKMEEEMVRQKRRTSSFDPSIFEKYVKNQDANFVLPKVTLPTLDDNQFIEIINKKINQIQYAIFLMGKFKCCFQF